MFVQLDDKDIHNIVSLLNRASVVGLTEAQLLIMLVEKLTNPIKPEDINKAIDPKLSSPFTSDNE